MKQWKIMLVNYTHQFGQLGRPRVGGNDSCLGNPVFIDGTQCSDCPLTFGCFVSTNQDAVWLLQIPHCCSFCKELWVGQHLKQWHDFRNLQNNRYQEFDSHTRAIIHTCRLRLGFVLASNIRLMLSAARTGTVLFSVTIL